MRHSVTHVKLQLKKRMTRSSTFSGEPSDTANVNGVALRASTFTATSWGKRGLRDRSIYRQSPEQVLLQAACRKELDETHLSKEIKEKADNLLIPSQTPEKLRGLSRETRLVDAILRTYTSVKVDEIRTEYHQTLLHLASSVAGNHELVRLLLDKWGADPLATDWTMRTPLHYAAAVGAAATASELLRKLSGSAHINKCDDSTESPLHEAAAHGNASVLKVLLREEKLDIDMADEHERTALHKAVAYGHSKLVTMLLKEGHADPDVEDEEDLCPLHYVASPSLYPQSRKTSAAVCTALIEHGAKVECHSESWRNETPLHMAALEGHLEVVSILLQKGGATINSRQEHNKTPLHYAVMREGNSEIVQLLVKSGADVSAQDDEGKTALHYAVEYKETGTVRVLLCSGADPSMPDGFGVKPLDIARDNRTQSILNLLQKTDT
eukprot:gb/GECG01016751.1/.p1 GENE.gb/GECG01016751.1/~~gb/GECG01016751.1/.p1  ORF type:complete len:439 (+),score=51.50 gb/GECG01016751.1/:1-1317(+)